MLHLLIMSALAAELTLASAIDDALRANLEQQQQDLRLERQRLAVLAERGRFDPTLGATVSTGASTAPNNSVVDGTTQLVSRSSGWSTSIDQALPTGGAVGLAWAETYSSSNSANVLSASTVSDRVALSIRQPLLRGVNGMIGVRAATLALTDEELAWRAATEQLVLDVSSGYWRLVSARESLILATRSREIAEQSVADATERYAAGFAGSGDVAQVERALGTARQAEVVARAEVEAADMALRRLMGREVTPGVALEPVERPVVPAELPAYADVAAAAKVANAAWRRQVLAFERARLEARQARNGALPDLSVTGQLGWAGLGESPRVARQQVLDRTYSDWGMGASMSVPLPGRPIRASLAQATLDRTTAELAVEAAEQDLMLRVRAAVRAAERDRLRVELAEDTVRVAKRALDADQELLREGKGATRDVVISLEALDQAQVAHLQAQIDLQASLLELRRVAGTLLP